ncbi:MAG: hypothetical protein DRO13_05740 [Thermoprotei archaeon]|nr:MAG: hypothetical protein DRO13_05740 [Thermoprotei archaeon]
MDFSKLSRDDLIKILKKEPRLVNEIPDQYTPRFTHLLNRELYPKEGWLSKYIDYCSFSPSPISFHFFSGVAALSAVVRRNVWLEFGQDRLFPNVYVVLLGPTGRVFKSTAIRIAESFVEALDVTTIIRRSTAEALANKLSYTEEQEPRDGIAFICARELVRVLGTGTTGVNTTIITALTDWYDCPDTDTDNTITRRNRMLRNIAITLLGGSTLGLLETILSGIAFESGFPSRVIFVYQEYTDRDRALPGKADVDVRLELLELLRDISRIEGGITIDQQANVYYDEWYKKFRTRQMLYDERKAEVMERQHVHLLKLSMLLALSEQRLTINERDVRYSSALLKALEGPLDEIIVPTTTSEFSKALTLVRAYIQQRLKVPFSKLVELGVRHGIDILTIERAVDSLRRAKLVSLVRDEKELEGVYLWKGGKR